MTKEEIIKQLETRTKERRELDELGFVDFVEDFFKRRKITPQEEINEGLKSYIENYGDGNVVPKLEFESKYGKLISMRDNPNWKDELKENYKQNLKKFLILFVVPIFSLTWGLGFVMDEIPFIGRTHGVFHGVFTSDLIVYYFQLLMLNIIIPIYIYNPLNLKLHSPPKSFDSVYNEILRRYNIGGNLLFFSSFISIFVKSFYFEYKDNLTWGDIRCLIIPVCVGFVFFYNSFLKNIKNE
jgi:hypothetical protein